MFQQLMKQVTQLAIDTEERLKGVIDLIFEKAISEPNFSVAYANMCRCLMAVSFHCFLNLVSYFQFQDFWNPASWFPSSLCC